MRDEPGEYVKDGIAYCSLHHAQLLRYRVSGSFLFSHYDSSYRAARDQFFPCSKWIEPDENKTFEAFYCDECERLQAAWLAQNS